MLHSPTASVQPGRATPSALRLLGRLALLCIGVRVGFEVIGLVAYAYYDQPVWANALRIWKQWDAVNYLRLAEVGYVRSSPPPHDNDPLFIAYLPFYPLAIRIVSVAVPSLLPSALIVSFAASVGAGYFLFRLVALDADVATAWRAVLLLFAFPSAYFLAAPYSEALSLCAVLASVYAARRGRWAGAGIAGALATGTRVTGIAIAPALLAEVFARRAGVRDHIRRLAWISLTSVGILTYLAINQIVHGDPLHFLEVQRTNWFQGLTYPWVPVRGAIEALWAGGLDFTFAFIYVGLVAGAGLAVVLLVLGVRYLRVPDILYGWACFLLMMSAAWLISLPRYLLALYPLFIVGARLTRSPRVLIPVIVASAALQVWLIWRYSLSQWTF